MIIRLLNLYLAVSITASILVPQKVFHMIEYDNTILVNVVINTKE